MQERLLDGDSQTGERRLVSHGQWGQQFRVGYDFCRATHSQRLVHARYQEQQTHVRMRNDVLHRVDLITPRAVGNQQDPFVQYRHESPGVASGGSIRPAISAERSDHAKRRHSNEIPAVLVKPVEHLLTRTLAQIAIDRTQPGLACDNHARTPVSFKV